MLSRVGFYAGLSIFSERKTGEKIGITNPNMVVKPPVGITTDFHRQLTEFDNVMNVHSVRMTSSVCSSRILKVRQATVSEAGLMPAKMPEQ